MKEYKYYKINFNENYAKKMYVNNYWINSDCDYWL